MNVEMRQFVAAFASGVILLAIGALGGWVLTVSDRVARIEERQNGNSEKVDLYLSAIVQRIGSLESLVSELNRRLRDGRTEGRADSHKPAQKSEEG